MCAVFWGSVHVHPCHTPATRFTTARKWNKPKCLPTYERMERGCYIYTLKLNVAVKKNWNCNVFRKMDEMGIGELSEISQLQETLIAMCKINPARWLNDLHPHSADETHWLGDLKLLRGTSQDQSCIGHCHSMYFIQWCWDILADIIWAIQQCEMNSQFSKPVDLGLSWLTPLVSHFYHPQRLALRSSS